MCEESKAIIEYGNKFHENTTGGFIASPLGAWLLIALSAHTIDPDKPEVSKLTKILGMPLHEAHEYATKIISSVPDKIALSVAAWTKDPSEIIKHLVSRLPHAVSTGAIPSQEFADSWTKEHSLGLIDKFPLDLASNKDSELILSSILALKAVWRGGKYENIPNTMEWNVAEMLSRRSETSSNAYIVQFDEGLYGVHLNSTENGVNVYSVIGPEGVDRAIVLRRAGEIANQSPHPVVPQESMNNDFIRVTEETRLVQSARGILHVYNANLPQWSMSTSHDLSSYQGVGGAEVAAGLNRDFDMGQSATASYSATGFEAAAVTALSIRPTSFAPQQIQETVVKTCSLYFHREYAVVAAYAHNSHRSMMHWRGLPLFTAWIDQSAVK